MEPDSQEIWVKKLETKLGELREQRIKVDEANEILRKKLQRLTKHLDDLDLKYGKDESDGKKETTQGESNETEKAAVDSNSTPVAPEPEKILVPDDQCKPTSETDEKNTNSLHESE